MNRSFLCFHASDGSGDLQALERTWTHIGNPSNGQAPLRGAGDQYSQSSSFPLIVEETKTCPSIPHIMISPKYKGIHRRNQEKNGSPARAYSTLFLPANNNANSSSQPRPHNLTLATLLHFASQRSYFCTPLFAFFGSIPYSIVLLNC